MNRSNRRTGPRPRPRRRRAAAAAEMVILLPMLAFVCMATVDFARVFYAWTTLADCARNGAIYASDSSYATSTTFTTASQAALADASNLSPAPTVVVANGTDSGGNSYVQVTVSCQFQTIGAYPGIPTSTALSRSLRMLVTPP